MAAGTTVREIAMMVHTHPTLSEVLDSAFKGAVGMGGLVFTTPKITALSSVLVTPRPTDSNPRPTHSTSAAH